MKSLRDNNGFSLVAVIVSAAILGILVLVASTMIKRSIEGQAHVSLQGDREALKRMMLMSVSCEKSLTDDECTANKPVTLRRLHKDGSTTVLVSAGDASKNRYGKWTLRADCNKTGDGVIMRAARLKHGKSLDAHATNAYHADPMTKKVFTFKDNESLLFAAGIELCTVRSPLFDLECTSRRYDDPVGRPSSNTRMHKCLETEEIMTQCRTVLYPSGDLVCGTIPARGRAADGRMYCTNHGCNAVPTQYWGTTVTCCKIVPK